MYTRTLLDTTTLTILHNLPGDYIQVSWRGRPEAANLLASYELVASALAQTQCGRLLNDQRALQGLWLNEAEWVARIWCPRVQAVGLRRHYVVRPTEYFARRCCDYLLELIPGDRLTGFDTYETALENLRLP